MLSGLMQASEVWGLDDCGSVEGVHLYTLEESLHESTKTPMARADGETRPSPLSIRRKLKALNSGWEH